jgi:hypothetical protein
MTITIITSLTVHPAYSFKEWVDIISELATVIGIFVLIYAYRNELLSKRALSFSVMESCIRRYQPIVAKLREEGNNPKHIEEYIAITKEELFYIHRGYIDKQVAIEWIEGMITYLPVYDKNGKQINTGAKISAFEIQVIVQSNVRIHNFAYTMLDVKENAYANPMTPIEKRKLAEYIYKRVRKFRF